MTAFHPPPLNHDVVVSHHQPLLREGLVAALTPAWRVRSAQGASVSNFGRLDSPRLVITDHDEALRAFGSPRRMVDGWDVSRSQWLVVSASISSAGVREALDRGVLGYVDTACPLQEIELAARTVASGRRYLCRTAATLLAERWLGEGLTPRELDVLKMLCFGLDNKSIGARLGVGPGTVKTHVKTLLQKMCVRNRTQAAIEGVQRGLLTQTLGPGQDALRPLDRHPGAHS